MIKACGWLGFKYVRVPFSHPRACNLCGYEGPFLPTGLYYIRPDAICASCRSTDRQRLLAFAVSSGTWSATDKDILHFAPEPNIVNLLKAEAHRYVTADLYEKADVAWNIESIPADDATFDAVFCSHVLEHVDAAKALAEIHRILRSNGVAFLMVPIYEAMSQSYFDASQTSEDQRYLHFHQPDHVRLLGRDFIDLVKATGFHVDEFEATSAQIIRHGLQRGEKVFIATKKQAGEPASR